MANESIIADFLLGKGLTRAHVAGILGNLKIESNFNPAAYNQNEKAIGLAQWQGGRRTRLQAFAAQMGGKETDLTIQLQFLWHELTGSEKNALHQLSLTTTPAAAAAFDQYYERSSGAARNKRIDAANTIYPNLGPAAEDQGFTTSGGGAAFRGQDSAFTTDAETGSQSGPSLWGGSWMTAIFPGLNVLESTSDGDVGGTLLAGIGRLLLPATIVAGGVALVIGGLVVAAKPAAQKALQIASDVK